MKTIKLFFFFALLLPFVSDANTLYVTEYGLGGTYSSIQSAINASSAGDKIIVEPVPSGYYTENITISHPLEIMGSSDTGQWLLYGSVTINCATAGNYNIINLKSVNGQGITCTTGPSGSIRANVSILNCTTGTINLQATHVNATVAYNISGSIQGYRLNAYGNSCSTIAIASDTTSNDTLYIIGNQCTYINWTNNTQWGMIANNYANLNSTLSAIGFSSTKTGSGGNTVINNSVKNSNTTNTNNGLISINSSGKALVDNNIAIGSGYTVYNYVLTLATGSEARYNFYSGGSWSGFVPDGSNGNYTGIIGTYGKGSITNNGNPAPMFTDLDLTRNDAGTYGGSYSMANYLPSYGHSRVYIVQTPRLILKGAQFNINAAGYDR